MKLNLYTFHLILPHCVMAIMKLNVLKILPGLSKFRLTYLNDFSDMILVYLCVI